MDKIEGLSRADIQRLLDALDAYRQATVTRCDTAESSAYREAEILEVIALGNRLGKAAPSDGPPPWDGRYHGRTYPGPCFPQGYDINAVR